MADEDTLDVSPAKNAPGKEGKGKATKKGGKAARTHAERAMGHIRAAKRGQREVSDPVGRAQLLLAEANALALLDVAQALGERSATD